MAKRRPEVKEKERLEMIGRKINKLLVLSFDAETSVVKHRDYYNCKCDCGKIKSIWGHLLRKKVPQISCGCAQGTMSNEKTRGKRRDPSKYWKSRENYSLTKLIPLSAKGQELVEEYLPFAIKVIHSVVKENEDWDEIFAEGYLGLIKAIEKLVRRPELLIKHSPETIIAQTIRLQIRGFRYIKRQDKCLYISIHGRGMVARLQKIKNLYYLRTGKQMSNEVLAKLTGVPTIELQDYFSSSTSLDSDFVNEDGEIEDGYTLVKNKNALDPSTIAELKEFYELAVIPEQRRLKLEELQRLQGEFTELETELASV